VQNRLERHGELVEDGEGLVKSLGVVVAQLEKELCMSISDGSCRAAVLSKWLDSLLEFVKLLSEVQSADQNFVPATALVRESGQAFRSDPFQEGNVRDVADALEHTSAQLGHALLPERGCRVLDHGCLVLVAVSSLQVVERRLHHAEVSAGCARRGE